MVMILTDLTHIQTAARVIALVLSRGKLVVLESTSPVGATEVMARIPVEERPDLTFPQTHWIEFEIRIAHCPERVMRGRVTQVLVSNNRVIGGMTSRCADMAAELYRVFVKGECIIASGPRAAEAGVVPITYEELYETSRTAIKIAEEGIR